MSEFIINSDQLERLIEGIEHKTDREINRVVCNGKELPSIVRCRDCKLAFEADHGLFDCRGPLATLWDYWNDDFKENLVEPDGFCAWGERWDA